MGGRTFWTPTRRNPTETCRGLLFSNVCFLSCSFMSWSWWLSLGHCTILQILLVFYFGQAATPTTTYSCLDFFVLRSFVCLKIQPPRFFHLLPGPCHCFSAECAHPRPEDAGLDDNRTVSPSASPSTIPIEGDTDEEQGKFAPASATV